MLEQYDHRKHPVQRTPLKYLLCLACGWVTTVSASGGLGLTPSTPVLLPAEQAITVARPAADQITLTMADGVYLYDARTRVEHPDGSEVKDSRPEGVPLEDPIFGRTPIHRGQITLILAESPERLTVHYQGCADIGFCYPPMQTELSFSR